MVIKLLLILACSLSGYFIALKYYTFPVSLIGLVLGLFLSIFVIQTEQAIRKLSLRVIFGGVIGTVLGLSIALLFTYGLKFVPELEKQEILPWGYIYVAITFILGYLGLVPSERSSGDKRHQGGITKAGNKRLRRLLVESAWHYRYYQPSRRLTQRRKGFPPEIVAYADKAGRRLSRKFQHLLHKGKKSQKVVTAIARELSGFIWGMANHQIA